MEPVVAPVALTGLSSTLQGQFTDWLERRKPQEEKMLRAYQDNMRISRDDDTKETGISKAQKSKIFVGSTRGKVRTARAKLKDALFSNGSFPFDTKPSNEKLKPFADTMEAILEYQLEDGHAKQVLGTGINAISVYGTGFIFGPFVKEKSRTTVEPTPMGLQEQTFSYACPYYEHARTMDVYPDPEAEDVADGLGVFWASRKQPEFVRALKGQEGYSDRAIDSAVQEKVSSYTDQGSDRTDQARMNLYRYTREGRVWFIRYFGLVKRRELEQWKRDNAGGGAQVEEIAPQDDDDAERVEAIVIMAGGQVIKAEENPYKERKRPVRRCVYEDVEHEMWGVGIPENNDPHQRVTNAAFRLFIEGKAFALLPISSIDRSKFEVTEDFKLFPGKRYLMKPGLTADERKEAILWHQIPDVTQGWESVIALSEKFSDDDTAITKYTQGDDASHLNKTAHGISMIMNAASLPLKEVLDNVDEMWIEDMVESLIDWNLEHLEPETVKALLGDEHAVIWAQIKAYGKTNFMEWFATGSQTFVAKEILMNKLQGFLQIVLGSEEAARRVDLTELLQQVWDAGQIGKESPILDDEELAKREAQSPNAEAMKHIQEIEAEAKKLIEQANERARAAEQVAAEAKRMEQYKMAELDAKEEEARRKHELALHDALNATVDAGHQSHLIEAQIDKLQAETLKTLREAEAEPDEEMEEAATSVEHGGEAATAAPKRPKKIDPLARLAEMHGQHLEKQGKTLEALTALAEAIKKPKRIVRNGSGRAEGIE